MTLNTIATGDRPPGDDLPRFLSIFEQVGQTMAYARARGVIHRDLKPSNIMAGAFGEVQVMDWGLAKVLPQGGIADEGGSRPDQATVIMTVRSGPPGSGGESQPGSVLGTPAYMAPEQARGEVDRIDERSDVFGLGAILCEILTGRPPFAGSSREAIRLRAARGDLFDAMARLDACGADAELIGLARDCLAIEPERRPRNAGEVARRISAYQAGVQERLRAAERARVEAQTRAVEEVKRRRLTVALAASVLIIAGLVGGGRTYLAQQRTARRMATSRMVIAALAEAERLRGQARSAPPGDPMKWFEVMAAARRCRDLLAQGEVDDGLRDRVSLALSDVEREQAEARRRGDEVERDRKLLESLESIRSTLAEHWDWNRVDDQYGAEFRAFGIDPDRLDPKEAGERIARRSEAAVLASYLDDWAVVRKRARGQKGAASWKRLLGAARASDPDPWRAALRDKIERGDMASLRLLAADRATLEAQPARSLGLLAVGLADAKDLEGAIQVLRQAWRRYPGDFWINFDLAFACQKAGGQAGAEEAVRFYSAALAVRPRSHTSRNNLGNVLYEQGKRADAIAGYRAAPGLEPDYPVAHINLGRALLEMGRSEESIAELRTAIRLDPDVAVAHANLGRALQDRGDLDQAIAECRTALRLDPDLSMAHSNLGAVLWMKGQLEGAIAECRTAVRLEPQDASAHCNLGIAPAARGQTDDAIAEFHAALRLKPADVESHINLGNALRLRGRPSEAIAEYREALRPRPDYPGGHHNLGGILREQGRLDEAIAAQREALRLKPDYPEAHYNLALSLGDRGFLDEAITEYRAAIRLKPDYPEAHCNLGQMLRRGGRLAEALAELRRGHELGSKDPRWPYPSAQWVRETERMVRFEKGLSSILDGRVRPAGAAESLGYAQLCYERKLYSASARLWAEALRAQPNPADDMQAQHRYNAACAAALAGCGQGKDDPPPDEAARARWRRLAIDWLRADLAAWSKILESGPPRARPAIAQTLQHWRADPDLAGLREPAAVEKLPKDEQDACRALWKEVDALLARAGGPSR